AWNDLARMSLRLAGTNLDPLAQFNEFMRRDEFTLEISSIELTLPKILADGPMTPTGSWIIFVENPKAPRVKRAFRAPDNAKGERIRLTPVDNKPLVYHPGDVLWAEIGLQDGKGNNLQLSWWANGVRSKLWQFDRLSRTPRLHKLDQKAEAG